MDIACERATGADVERIYRLCRQLIDDYEDAASIDRERVLRWVRGKIESSIGEYRAIYADGAKAGYYHFFRNEDGEYELDDLYVFPEHRGRGIGSEVIRRCCASVDEPVMLYVFIRNRRAIALYERLGFRVEQTIRGSRYIMRRPSA